MPLRRSKTDANHGRPPPRPWHILVVADDPDGAEILVRLLARPRGELGSRPAGRSGVADSQGRAMRRPRPDRRGRRREPQGARRHPHEPRRPCVAGARVVLCSPGGTNRLFAWSPASTGSWPGRSTSTSCSPRSKRSSSAPRASVAAIDAPNATVPATAAAATPPRHPASSAESRPGHCRHRHGVSADTSAHVRGTMPRPSVNTPAASRGSPTVSGLAGVVQRQNISFPS